MATHISSNTPTDRHTTNTILSTFFLVIVSYTTTFFDTRRVLRSERNGGGDTERFRKSDEIPEKEKNGTFRLLVKYKRVKHVLKPAYREAHFSRSRLKKKKWTLPPL